MTYQTRPASFARSIAPVFASNVAAARGSSASGCGVPIRSHWTAIVPRAVSVSSASWFSPTPSRPAGIGIAIVCHPSASSTRASVTLLAVDPEADRLPLLRVDAQRQVRGALRLLAAERELERREPVRHRGRSPPTVCP